MTSEIRKGARPSSDPAGPPPSPPPLPIDRTQRHDVSLKVIDGDYKVVSPLVTEEEAIANWERYQRLVTKVIDPKTDVQTFTEDGKQRSFLKKSAWLKLGTYYGISTEMVNERLFHKHDPKTCLRVSIVVEVAKNGNVAVRPFEDVSDCGCPVVGARYVVRASAPNGRTSEGIGLATFNEKRAKYTRVEHDLATKAYTRAMNRAIATMIGAGEVSAEEAHATGEVRSLSDEQRAAIKGAWSKAPKERQDAALAIIRDMGIPDGRIGLMFARFDAVADDEDVDALLAALRPPDEPFADFDADAVGKAHGETPPPDADAKGGHDEQHAAQPRTDGQ